MTRARILVVEDDNIIALELKDRLQVMGYTVLEVVGTGEAAMERAAGLRPDLVLMDIRLRGALDGVEAAAEIRTRLDLPVVYLTAYADDHTLARAKLTEPYGFIIKPFEERELETVIEIALYKHEMERRLREREQWLETTLASMGDAVIATDAGQRITFVNPAAAALTGWEQAAALGRPVTEILDLRDEEGRSVAGDLLSAALARDAVVLVTEHLLTGRAGGQLYVDGSAAAIRGAGTWQPGAVLVFRDVSERKRQEEERRRLQAELLQAQKIEALGVLAGGIAHDFSNLLTTVIGYSSLALARLGDDDPLRPHLESIHRAGERAASLTEQLLTLSRTEMGQPQVLSLNDVLLEHELMLRHRLGEDVDLRLELAPGLSYVRVDPIQIKRALVNLVVNAGEALPSGGVVTLATRNLTVAGGGGGDDGVGRAGRQVCLSVTDTGVGMDAETRQRIFEPFFTTKDHRVGLGLTVVYGIVRQYEGSIDVVSEPGQGATFQICLPEVFEDLAHGAARNRPALQARGAGERVLLVEDEDTVRSAVGDMLRAGGYEVVAVGTVEQALYIFGRNREPFDLLFSDVVLPDGDGLHLAAELEARQPGLAILISSGQPGGATQWPIVGERGWQFLPKPYSLDTLLPAVRLALACHQEGGGL